MFDGGWGINKSAIEGFLGLEVGKTFSVPTKDWRGGSNIHNAVYYHGAKTGKTFSVKKGWGQYNITRKS